MADHVYLVCEPPGEPYYLGRIMEFMHANNDAARPVDSVRINWFYRPKDIGRKASDTRMLFASMHSDISPLTALRGKCQIKHRLEIKSMDDYRRRPDSFWFEKLYDRYIQKNYDLIPTQLIVNVPEKVKKVLDERWKYVLVEQGRGKELTSALKLCFRCQSYSARYVRVLSTCRHDPTRRSIRPRAGFFFFSFSGVPARQSLSVRLSLPATSLLCCRLQDRKYRPVPIPSTSLTGTWGAWPLSGHAPYKGKARWVHGT